MKTAMIHCRMHGRNEDVIIYEDQYITHVGNEADLHDEISDCDEIIDLRGMFVSPGFVDSHMHLLELGFYLSSVQLDGCTSVEDIQQACRKGLNTLDEGDWLLGRGYNEDRFIDGSKPDKAALDAISTDVPIALTRACGHVMTVNSKVLEIAGITEDFEMEGGRIIYETGRVEENAINLIHGLQKEPDVEKLQSFILKGQEYVNACGITTVGSDDFISVTHDYRGPLDAYEKLSYQGRLTVRVNQQCEFADDQAFASFLDDGYTFDVGNDFFRIGPLKLILDGSLGARTAAMNHSYQDDSTTKGTMCMDKQDMERDVMLANRFNMPTIAHCIGDRAVDEWLDVLQDHICPGNPLHHGIVHCQILREDQIRKIIDLNLSCYYQSIFIDYDASIVSERVGSQLAETSYPFHTLYEGTLCSNGSDAPVEMPDVMKGLECAVTRKSLSFPGKAMNPKECLSVEEAMATYTINGARQLFMEDRIGAIKEGYYADFAVLDQNPYEVETDQLHTVRVMMTVMDGRMVYTR